MIKILQVRNIDSFVESRRQKTSEKDKKTVQSILNDVRKNGDSAVKKYEHKFNGRKTSQLRVSAKEIKEAKSKISRKEYKAIGEVGFWLDFNENWLKMNVKEAIEKMSADSKLNKELLEEDGFPIIEIKPYNHRQNCKSFINTDFKPCFLDLLLAYAQL